MREEASTVVVETDPVRLADRIALRSLAEQYAFGADRRDGALFAGQFTPAGRMLIWDHGHVGPPSRVREGRQELARGVDHLTQSYRVTMHVLGQHAIEFTGDDTAIGEIYCVAHHVRGEPPEGGCFTMYVRYLDQYVRLDDRWFIEERKLICEWTEQRRLDPGDVGAYQRPYDLMTD